jgi:hypothetical protein
MARLPLSRERMDAYNAVQRALRSGRLVRPYVCEDCGQVDTKHGREGPGQPMVPVGWWEPVAHHHHGYDREHALDVVWLCLFCHSRVHLAEKTEAIRRGVRDAPKPDGSCRQCGRVLPPGSHHSRKYCDDGCHRAWLRGEPAGARA